MSDVLRELCLRLYMRGREARGQTAAEYVGVLLVVSVIIAAVATTGVGHDITDTLSSLVRDISGGDSGKK
jgi:Flp pilus assembly pilin Flp